MHVALPFRAPTVLVWNAHFLFFSIIHAKTPENADQNGHFRKQFQKWSFCFKTERFKKCAVFSSEIAENGGFWKTVPKKASNTVAFINVYRRFSFDENASKGMWRFQWKLSSVDTANKLVWSKLFCFGLVQTKTNTVKNWPIRDKPLFFRGGGEMGNFPKKFLHVKIYWETSSKCFLTIQVLCST